MDDVFRALADPSRRELLDRLNARNGQTLTELCAGLGMTRQSVTKHLAVLEGANLVSVTRRGRERLHFLNPVPVQQISDRWMSRFDRERVTALADLKTSLEGSVSDPEFVYVTYIRTTPDRLWTALTDPAWTKRFWGVELESDWTVGAPVRWVMPDLTVEDDGQVVVVADRPHTLAYTWHAITPEFVASVGDEEFGRKAAAEPRSTVTFTLEPQGDVVRLTVAHGGFEPGGVIQAGVSTGWPEIMASLKSLLETGEPLATVAG